MRRNWRVNRVFLLFVSLISCAGLITLSSSGAIKSAEGVISIPLQALAGIANDVTQNVGGIVDDLSEIQALRQRNAELEEALTQLQKEIIEYREINNDYFRLSELLGYTSTALNQETVTAEVISFDQNSLRRTILINRGARDGIARGMPVVTDAGLVGRIIDVFANASRVLLVTDPNSAISARVQDSRAQGSAVGLLTGGIRLDMVPLEDELDIGDIVITSGLGGNFPADIPIGQVVSRRQFEFDLNQTAELRSFINFDILEVVLVVTNFQPTDLSTFEEDETQ